MTTTRQDDASNQHTVIIGTGFSGLGMAIQLKGAGIEDFTILEQAGEVGGTWRDNHYPGAACDVPTYLYSFSFEQNPGWSKMFGPQKEIFDYMIRCSEKYGLRSKIKFNTAVVKAVFDDASGLWDIHTSDGNVIRARNVVSGCGGLSRPAYPDIPGLSSFKGKVFHSARWDHSVPLEGKTVAVIGTGASAIQIVPAIAPKVGKMHLFQRTPPWIIPKPDRDIGAAEQALYKRVPLLQEIVRDTLYWVMESFAVGFVIDPRLMKLREMQSLAYLKRVVKDPVLRDKLTPKYTLGCKRILFTNDYYPAVTRPNVELVTDGITRITERGIVTADGKERELDTLVLATGFHVMEKGNMPSFDTYGSDGTELGEFWEQNRFQAYEGMAVPRFPNHWIVVGPYSVTGASWFSIAESGSRHVMRCLLEARSRRATRVEVTERAHRDYHAKVLERMPNTVFFSGNCGGSNSYYFDERGDAPLYRPAGAIEQWWHSGHFPLEDYAFG